MEKRDQGKIGIDELGWWRKKSSYSHGVGCWKSILAGLERFKSLVHFEVRDTAQRCYFGTMFGVGIVIEKSFS